MSVVFPSARLKQKGWKTILFPEGRTCKNSSCMLLLPEQTCIRTNAMQQWSKPSPCVGIEAVRIIDTMDRNIETMLLSFLHHLSLLSSRSRHSEALASVERPASVWKMESTTSAMEALNVEEETCEVRRNFKDMRNGSFSFPSMHC